MAGADGETVKNPRVREAVAKMRAQRDETLWELGRLTEADLRTPARWSNLDRSVQFLLRVHSLHEIDHLQHAQRLLRARGMDLSEAQLILQEAQALRGRLEAIFLSLSDEEFEAAGPGEDWSMKQLVDHLTSTCEGYLHQVREGLAAAAASSNGAPRP